MASSPITSELTDGEKVETVADFILLGSEITADSDCSYEIQTTAPWKKSYDKPTQCIKKKWYPIADKGIHSQSYALTHVDYDKLRMYNIFPKAKNLAKPIKEFKIKYEIIFMQP